MEWKIGNFKIKNQVVVAPMAGISNPSFMKICEEMGAGYAVSELISAEAIVRNNKKTLDMLMGIEDLNIPVAIQIFGSNAEVMSEASKIITSLYKNVFIDINMGCPVPKIAIKSKAGSALLKDLNKIEEIVSKVVKSVSVPVTVKIRSGWDDKHINAKEVAMVCEKAGAMAICVHPRTRSQGYSGTSNWDIIKEVKKSVSIPVIGNGDIRSALDAKRMIDLTGCDAVMIARGLLGNPFLIREINEYLDKGIIIDKPTYKEKLDMCQRHLEYLSAIKCEKVAVLEMRGHIPHYLKGLKNASIVKQKVCKATKIDELKTILKEYEKELRDNNEVC